MLPIKYISAFIIPIIISAFITPFIIKLAKYVGAIDEPNERKVHTDPTPRLGGLAIYLSFFISFGIICLLYHQFFVMTMMDLSSKLMLGGALTFILLLGVWDDIQTLRPGIKFLVQFVIANLIYFAGFKISSLTNVLNSGFVDVGYLDYPITILWIIGVTNAFNLIDGLDGLAPGVAVISSVTIGILTYLQGDLWTTLLVTVLAGAILGFLWYNFNPAQIFLGDAGSLLLGFTLAIVSMKSYTKTTTIFPVMLPVLVLGFPIMDTIVAMIRRFLKSFIPNKNGESESVSLFNILHSIFLPDKSHIHHQLIQKGYSQKSTVLLLYLVSGLYSMGALGLTVAKSQSAVVLILFATVLVTIWGIKKLRYREMEVLHNGIFLTLYKRGILKRKLIHQLLDIGFIAVACIAANNLMIPDVNQASSHYSYTTLLLLTVGIQYGTFWISGLYKETISRLCIGDVMNILKSVSLATFISGLVVAYLENNGLQIETTLFILDFYFLLSMVLGLRVSFHMLNYLYRRYQISKKNILIYGAGENGILALQDILINHNDTYNPLGFIDDDHHLAGAYVNGYAVFGTHWQLPKLIQSREVHELLITTEKIKTENLKRVKKIAWKYDIKIRQLQISLTDVSMQTSNKKKEQVTYA